MTIRATQESAKGFKPKAVNTRAGKVSGAFQIFFQSLIPLAGA
ncbi:hypothetical protein [Sedimentisphaera salicampi]|nr:hypothetical protein [Sedimentisphaera salicampi]